MTASRACGATPDVARHDDFRRRTGDRPDHRRLVAGLVRLAFRFRIPGGVWRDPPARCKARLPETLPRRDRQLFRLGPLTRNYWTLGRSGPLFLLSSAIALDFCGFFIYIVSAPAFIYDLLGLGATDFPWLFVPGIAGVMVGAFLSGRLAGKVSPRMTVHMGFAVIFTAALMNLAYSALAPPAVPWSVAPVMVYTIGMALAMPSLTLLALDLFPHNRGLSASLLGFEHSLLSGIAAGVISPLLFHSDITLALGMAGLALMGWSSWLLYLGFYGRRRSA